MCTYSYSAAPERTRTHRLAEPRQSAVVSSYRCPDLRLTTRAEARTHGVEVEVEVIEVG